VITLLFRVFGVPHRRHVVILLGCVIAVVLFGAELFALAEVEAGTAAVGKRLSAVRSERLGLVLGLVRDGEFTLGLSDDPVIASGDRLLVAEARGV
jgi:hypothetical protein